MVQTAKSRAAEKRAVSGEKTDLRRREVLRAASHLFRERGFHGAGMRDIAASLDMHVGNLYYYFESKQALLAFCQRDALDRLQTLAETVTRQEDSPDRQLYLLIVGHLECLHVATPGSLAHLEVEALESGHRRSIVEQRDRYERQVRSILQAGMDSGVFRSLDVSTAALTVLGALNWTVKWLRTDGRRSVAELGEAMAEQLLRGLVSKDRPIERPDLTALHEWLDAESFPSTPSETETV